MGVTGTAFSKPPVPSSRANGATSAHGGLKPPLGMGVGSRASTAASSRRIIGNVNAKEDKKTSIITIDDLQRLREQVNLGGAYKTDE